MELFYVKDLLLNVNYSLIEDQLAELKQEKDKWKKDEIAALSQNSNHFKFHNLFHLEYNYPEKTIKEIKDKIFKFLINERNKGADETRVDFYQSILNLLNLAKDPDEDHSFDLSSLINYFTNEGKKEFGKHYEFHKQRKDDEFIQNAFEPTIDQNIRASIRKLNKSEERIMENADLYRVIHGNQKRAITPLESSDNTFLTENMSTIHRKKKGGKKKTKMYENKIKELNEQIDKLKSDVQVSQKKMRDTSFNASMIISSIGFK